MNRSLLMAIAIGLAIGSTGSSGLATIASPPPDEEEPLE